jgi:hypothetical protein
MKRIALILSMVLLLITSLTGFTYANNTGQYKQTDVDNYFIRLAENCNATIVSDTCDKAGTREMIINWGDNIISNIVQEKTNDGSEKYIITEGDITNEMVISPTGEILVDGKVLIEGNASNDILSDPIGQAIEYGENSVDSLNNSQIGILANCVKYETATPLVGAAYQYGALTNATAYQSVAFQNAISGITFSVFVTLLTGGCTWYFSVSSFWSGVVGCLTSGVTGGLTNVYDFLKMNTPTATSTKYKVFTYSYSGNTLSTHAEQAVTRFYTNANVICGTGGVKYITLVI